MEGFGLTNCKFIAFEVEKMFFGGHPNYGQL